MLRLQLAGDVSRLDFSPFVRLIPKAARSYQGTAMALTYVSGEFANSLAFNGSFDIDLGGQTLSGDVRFAGERLIPGRELDSTLQYYVIRFTIIQKDLDLYSLSVVRGPESSPGTTTTLNFDYKPSAPESFVSGEYSSVSTRYFSTTPIVSQSALASSVISPNPIPVCFTTGTLIRTARGEVAVEDLIVGDLAVTASGALRPITWIGYRRLEHLAPEQQPVRVRTGAFGSSLPVRDLFLSAGHPVLVGADAAVALARGATLGPDRPSLARLSAALASQMVGVGAHLGGCTLTLAELSALEPGDVVVLEHPAATPVDLVVDRSPRSLARCDLRSESERLSLHLLESINR